VRASLESILHLLTPPSLLPHAPPPPPTPHPTPRKSKPDIKACKASENWTAITFQPDLAKFDMEVLEDDVVALMRKRVYDCAGVLGKGCKVRLCVRRAVVSRGRGAGARFRSLLRCLWLAAA